ncbi:hypothetical protein [Clostridium cylindrosporum]|uniref:Uncharacterized protein n=1 Tax=Clostridium cylindrosporum DSM 605 TaxID=1121307 RepID=A0A0J8DAP2_CLOCY|nr:hypothetical protein [Clostridium cylindrosporum]KMT22917.1 hypothetical protein CLCY_5c01560 [Clostridium cylindrosporum DSM 605]
MRKFKILVVGLVISFTVLAVGYLMYIINKIESESVMNQGMRGIILFTTNKENSKETENILKGLGEKLAKHMNIKILGSLDSVSDVENVIKEDSKDSINYNIIEFNRSNLVREKDTVVIRIPDREALNYRESLERAEKIRDKSDKIKVNIIESKNTPKLLNTYMGIEVSDAESSVNAKKILDQLILLNE